MKIHPTIDYEALIETRETVEQAAAAKDLFCLFPEPDELTIDIDRPNADVNPRIYAFLCEKGIILPNACTTRSKSGNTHVWIKLRGPVVSELERAALQSMLGSDSMREVLGFWRNQQTSREVVFAMFETEEEADRVQAWRTMHKEDRIDYDAISRFPVGCAGDDFPEPTVNNEVI